ANPPDPTGTLPITGTLSSTGVGYFLGNLKTAGSYVLTATAGAVTGASANLAVAPAPAVYFSLSAPAAATTGSPFSVTARAMDQFSNLATSYQGKAHFTSSDAAAVLPSDSILAGGVGVFNVTLSNAGSQTISATDNISASPITMTGTSLPILTRGLTVTSF